MEKIEREFKLPCLESCVFNKQCASKFRDGGCADKINTFISNNIQKQIDGMFFHNGQIEANIHPHGHMTVAQGIVYTTEPSSSQSS